MSSAGCVESGPKVARAAAETLVGCRLEPVSSTPRKWPFLTVAQEVAGSSPVGHIKEYATVPGLFTGLSDYFDLCNYERPHQSLDYTTPA